jgi:hypothetical protein
VALFVSPNPAPEDQYLEGTLPPVASPVRWPWCHWHFCQLAWGTLAMPLPGVSCLVAGVVMRCGAQPGAVHTLAIDHGEDAVGRGRGDGNAVPVVDGQLLADGKTTATASRPYI